MKIKNYYKILGLESSATGEEIKEAFKRLARKYHPDKNKDDKKAGIIFKEINEAYSILGDLDKRLKYNILLNKSKRHNEEISTLNYLAHKKKK